METGQAAIENYYSKSEKMDWAIGKAIDYLEGNSGIDLDNIVDILKSVKNMSETPIEPKITWFE